MYWFRNKCLFYFRTNTFCQESWFIRTNFILTIWIKNWLFI